MAGTLRWYGATFTESDDLRVLDFNGDRAFRLFRFSELGPPIMYELYPR